MHQPDPDRYSEVPHSLCGHSGLDLPRRFVDGGLNRSAEQAPLT